MTITGPGGTQRPGGNSHLGRAQGSGRPQGSGRSQESGKPPAISFATEDHCTFTRGLTGIDVVTSNPVGSTARSIVAAVSQMSGQAAAGQLHSSTASALAAAGEFVL